MEAVKLNYTHKYSATVTFTVYVQGKLPEGFSESMIPSLAIERAADILLDKGPDGEDIDDIEVWTIEP
jgi:hypothetical protein